MFSSMPKSGGQECPPYISDRASPDAQARRLGLREFVYVSTLWAHKQVPGFAEFAVEALLGAVFGIEQEADAAFQSGNGDDVPGLFGDYVDDQEIDLRLLIGDGALVEAAAAVDVVGVVVEIAGGFDLDAPEAGVGVENEVVTVAVAVRLGDFEAALDGGELEDEFGELSATLGFAAAGGAESG